MREVKETIASQVKGIDSLQEYFSFLNNKVKEVQDENKTINKE